MAAADDEISLEDLMSSTAQPGKPGPADAASPQAAAAGATPAGSESGPKDGDSGKTARSSQVEVSTPEEDQKSVEFLDKVLAENDPQFLSQMKGIASQKIETDQAIDSIDGAEMPSPAAPLIEDDLKSAKGLKAVKLRLRAARVWANHRLDWVYEKRDRAIELFHELRGPGAKFLLAKAKDVLIHTLHRLKDGLAKAKNFVQEVLHLPKSAKLKILCGLFLLAVFVFVSKLTLKGELLRRYEPQMLTSFALVADHQFDFPSDEVFENFYSPLRTPDAIVELEKIVVNLRATPEHPKPMGMFEVYAAADSREAAIEIGDRKNDMKDRVSRVVEELTYEEVATTEGKARMKLLIRKELNSELQNGKVKRIYFKTIVLKP